MADLGCLDSDFIQRMTDLVGHPDIGTGQGRAPLVHRAHAHQARGDARTIQDPGEGKGSRGGAETLGSGAESVDDRTRPGTAVVVQACRVTLTGTA